ncbi:MAG: PH domain-containing protein [Terriglobales bacterium]
MGRRFHSKVGGLWRALMAVPLLPLMIGLLTPARAAVAIAAVLWGIFIWLLAATWYEIDDRELRVRSGPFRWRVPLGAIEGVDTAPSFEARILSGPALSLDRLVIHYRNSGGAEDLAVSPADRTEFLAALGAARGQAR